MKTIKQLVREVEEIQNACNLSGVLHGAAAAAVNLRALLEAPGSTADRSTGALNRHPIMRAWAHKIGDMAGLMVEGYPAEELRLLLAAPDTAQDLVDAAA